MLSVTSERLKPRPTYDELAEEVTRLRAILEPTYFNWSRRMGVTPMGARILWLLLHRPLVTHDAIASALLHDLRERDQPENLVNCVRAHISHLRDALERRYGFARPPIKNVFGVGYEMDAEYRALLRKEILKVQDS